MLPLGSTHSFLPRHFFFLSCLLFQVMKTERLTETFSCCFHDLDDMPKPPNNALSSPPEQAVA